MIRLRNCNCANANDLISKKWFNIVLLKDVILAKKVGDDKFDKFYSGGIRRASNFYLKIFLETMHFQVSS